MEMRWPAAACSPSLVSGILFLAKKKECIFQILLYTKIDPGYKWERGLLPVSFRKKFHEIPVRSDETDLQFPIINLQSL